MKQNESVVCIPTLHNNASTNYQRIHRAVSGELHAHLFWNMLKIISMSYNPTKMPKQNCCTVCKSTTHHVKYEKNLLNGFEGVAFHKILQADGQTPTITLSPLCFTWRTKIFDEVKAIIYMASLIVNFRIFQLLKKITLTLN